MDLIDHSPPASPLTVGDSAIIRGRRWRIAWIASHRDCASIRVVCDDPAVSAATFLHPFEDVRPIAGRGRIRRTSRGAAMAALGRALAEAAPFPALVSTSRAAIDLFPYQLEPALSLVAGTATRVLIADDVGLGKTIQAGIAIAELSARDEAAHTLVIAPAGLLDQWADELRSRFGLPVERVDAAWLRLASRSLPPWVSPWALPSTLLVSIDLLKRREVLSQVQHVAWDLVVIDEAHRATGATDRHAAAAHVSARARRLVLLTATPHADADAFASIQELGAVPGEPLRTLTFSRTRAAVAPHAMRRRARYLRVQPTREERLMHAALDGYVCRMLRAARGPERDAVRLAMIVLKKRVLSGAFSLRRSLARRLASVEGPQDLPAQLGLAFDADPSGELVSDDEEPDAVLGAASFSVPREREQLTRLIALASAAALRESKVNLLRRVLTRTRDAAIVFTEYRDTLQHVLAEIAPVTSVAALHGGLRPDDRRRALSAFTRGGARVLVATDAAAEGLNLQARCRWVINFELPWAPLRLIQRAGRVDRIGQLRRVHAWHLVAEGTDETRLLLSLSARAESAESALAAERAIGERVVADALLDGGDVASGTAGASPRLFLGGTGRALREKTRLEFARERAALSRRRADPGIAEVKRRRGFGRYVRGDRLLVFAGRALDSQGCPIAMRLGIARASGPRGRNDLERQLHDDVLRYERSAGVAATRRRAISLLLDRSQSPVQPALFDRRALDARDAAERAIAGAQRQLDTRAAGSPSLLFDVVAGFEVK